VARAAADINAFIDAHGDTILKPLDGMGGSQIFRVRADDPNRNVIIETLTQDERHHHGPGLPAGDQRRRQAGADHRRAGHPYSLARIPMAGETRGNLAAGGRGVAMPLTDGERAIAEHLAPSCGRAACSSSAST
jgi:glutathione synthase